MAGAASETIIAKEIEAEMNAPFFSTVGCFGFDELVALISLAPLLICNNSGPANITGLHNGRGSFRMRRSTARINDPASSGNRNHY